MAISALFTDNLTDVVLKGTSHEDIKGQECHARLFICIAVISNVIFFLWYCNRRLFFLRDLSSLCIRFLPFEYEQSKYRK